MDIDRRLLEIIRKIEDLGHQVVIVGGAVRNHLLNIKVSDYDLASSANIEDLAKVFLNSEIIYRKQVPWALKLKYQDLTCEISTFRIEENYKDQVPQTITFTKTFKEDVLRRDFTINAIGYEYNKGYLDYVGGLQDIDNRLVRIIGDANVRFNEDPMRILRAIRLASTLNLKIEKNTLQTINDLYKIALSNKTLQVSNELKQILAGSNFNYVFKVVNPFFMHISEGKLKNISIDNRTALLNDDMLLVYLLYKEKLKINNPIFQYLYISVKVKNKIENNKYLIQSFINKISKKSLLVLLFDYQEDQIIYITKLLYDLQLISLSKKQFIIKTIKFDKLKVSDLDLNIDEILSNVSVKEKYLILESILKQVALENIPNKSSVLLKEIDKMLKE